jgi:sporulation protein YlmC with PRC-barrel domain
MATASTATLHSLGDTDLALADRAEDIRGRQVLDAGGEEVGEVEDLLIDDERKKVRFLRVASGGFLGLGETKFLIPVDAVSRVDEEHVHIDRTRDKLTGAPRYDPQLVDRAYLDRLYGYYGHRPYWSAGYTYPAFPYYLP